MEQILINLVTGALGGVGVGKSSPTFDLGMIGNIISGLIGGGIISQAIAGDAILTAIIGANQKQSCCLRGRPEGPGLAV